MCRSGQTKNALVSEKKKLKGHIITILIGLNLNIKGWIFKKKIALNL